ncbi:MAG: 30S ribosomal protein S4 [Patescibacteria group bacterium]
MARITSPVCSKCRREGEKLFLKGERCVSPKCSFTRRSYIPGQHGANGRKPRLSEYGTQLRAKQKAKAIYGVLERQFSSYYKQMNTGSHGQTLLTLVERRLDNVVFRLGIAPSRAAARQLVSHGRITVKGRRLTIPSYQVRVGDTIAVTGMDETDMKAIGERQKKLTPVSWLKMNVTTGAGEVTSLPKSEDMTENIEERLIIEYYSR